MSVDILGTSCDQCRSMVQYSFTSMETRRLVRMDSPGRPPQLSHSSWTTWERCCCWLLLCSTILRSWADSLHSHVILHEWLAFHGTFLNIHPSGALTVVSTTLVVSNVQENYIAAVFNMLVSQPASQPNTDHSINARFYTWIKNKLKTFKHAANFSFIHNMLSLLNI